MASRTVNSPPPLKDQETSGRHHNFVALRLADFAWEGGARTNQWILGHREKFKQIGVKATDVIKRFTFRRAALHGSRAKTDLSNDCGIHHYLYALRNSLGFDKGQRAAWMALKEKLSTRSLLGLNKPELPLEESFGSKVADIGVALRHCVGQTD